MLVDVGNSKLMLFTLADNRFPFGPWHELFMHGNVFIETVKNIFLVMFKRT